MIQSSETMNALARIFHKAAKEVIESSTGAPVSSAQTMQKIAQVSMRPDIACFVLFSGDYSGLLLMNFSGDAALAIYHQSMIRLGIPAEELAQEFTSDEVVNFVGEMINQIIGKARREVEHHYGLTAKATQPRAIALTSPILLTVDSHDVTEELCRRLSFKVAGHSFHIEMAMEKMEFLSLAGGNPHEEKSELSHGVDLKDYQKQAAEPPAKVSSSEQPDFESLMAQNK